MANKKISQLPLINSANDDSFVPIVQNGVTSKIRYGSISTGSQDFFPGSLVIPSRKSATATATFATRSSDITGVPFKIDVSAVVTGMSIRVASATASPRPTTSAIYKYDFVANEWNLIEQIPIGVFDSQVVGYQTASFSENLNLKSGIYFHCVQSSVGFSLNSSVSDNFDNVFGFNSASGIAHNNISVSYSYNGGVLPTTITSWTYSGINFGHAFLNIA